jgi:tetratricopeptide (TPR) repeat protein
MKTKYKILFAIALHPVAFNLSSCKKMLDEKSDKSITTISNIRDLKAIMNANDVLNNLGVSLADVGADEYILSSSSYDQLRPEFQQAVRWDENANPDAWSQHYAVVYYANVVLQELNRISDGSSFERNVVKGQALFFRSLSFYQLAQFYCKPFGISSSSDLGIPLRLTPNTEERIFRSSVSDTYKRIIDDLKVAADLLPPKFDAINQPGKLACLGLLARTYLSMGDYESALRYSNLYLEVAPELLDYNTLDTLASPSMPANNKENQFVSIYVANIPSRNTAINPDLFNLYDTNDLRRTLLFKVNHTSGAITFKGSYSGIGAHNSFCGIATDEVYLIQAECLSRLKKNQEATNSINELLKHRYKNGTFIPVDGLTDNTLTNYIITERRKELVFRGTRWSDLRRLNQEGSSIQLTRNINGNNYTLPANDKRWVWLIPQAVIIQSGIQQNDR